MKETKRIKTKNGLSSVISGGQAKIRGVDGSNKPPKISPKKIDKSTHRK